MLPPDQVIEQTINKEQKGPGGIIGIRISIGSVQRWVLSSHITATLSTDFKLSLDLDTPCSVPKDLGKNRKSFDESCVSLCHETIRTWNNPFQQSKSIVSLSSGVAANSDVEHDLLNAEKVGEAQLEEFVSSRIESNNVSFYERIKKNKLMTFDSAVKKCVVKGEGKQYCNQVRQRNIC